MTIFGARNSTSQYKPGVRYVNGGGGKMCEIVLDVTLHNIKDKRFAVEAPIDGKSNCDRPPVAGLKTSNCYGSVKISDGSDARKASHPRKPAGRNMGIPLDEMSPEELKMLLKEILQRL